MERGHRWPTTISDWRRERVAQAGKRDRRLSDAPSSRASPGRPSLAASAGNPSSSGKLQASQRRDPCSGMRSGQTGGLPPAAQGFADADALTTDFALGHDTFEAQVPRLALLSLKVRCSSNADLMPYGSAKSIPEGAVLQHAKGTWLPSNAWPKRDRSLRSPPCTP
jgi:hypothetical protein